MKYNYRKVKDFGYIITEEGHTMFPEDVKRRLDELKILKKQLIQERQAKKELVEALEATVQVLKRLLWINSFLSILTNAEQLINKYKEKE